MHDKKIIKIYFYNPAFAQRIYKRRTCMAGCGFFLFHCCCGDLQQSFKRTLTKTLISGCTNITVRNIFGLDFPLGVQTLLATLSVMMMMRIIECAEMCCKCAVALQHMCCKCEITAHVMILILNPKS